MQKKKEIKTNKLKQMEGITLIALIITVIVLLILAGVTINLTIGENGIFKTAQLAARNYTNEQLEEMYGFNTLENKVNSTLQELVQNSTTPNITVTSIEIASTVTSINPGGSTQLVATILPENSTNKKVKWVSQNTDIATVTQDGTVTAIAVGTVTITATAEDGSNVQGSWTITIENPTYTITYNANGGTGAPEAQTATIGENINISSTIPTKTCCTFNGWKVGSNTLQAGQTYTGGENITLVAQWSEPKHNWKFSHWEKTNAASYFTCTSGEKVNVLYETHFVCQGCGLSVYAGAFDVRGHIIDDWGDGGNTIYQSETNWIFSCTEATMIKNSIANGYLY